MKYIIIFTSYILFLPANSAAQLSGSGAINNYLIGCTNGSSCVDTSTLEVIHMFTAPSDGDLKVEVTFSETSVECCGSTHNFNIVGALETFNGSSTFYNFDPTVNTGPYTILCVKKDDEFRLTFGGQKGKYQYQVTLIPPTTDIDIEPNDVVTQAIDVNPNMTQEGTIGYGRYSNKDQSDWYSIVADSDGNLQVDFQFNEPMNVSLRKKTNNNAVIIESNNASPGQAALIAKCVAEGDTLFVQVSARSNDCADYSFKYEILNKAIGDNDIKANDDIPNAQSVPNMPGDIKGRIRYGIFPIDGQDYFSLGEMMNGDSLHFTISATKNPINVEIKHLGGFPKFNFNDIQAEETKEINIQSTGPYFMKVEAAFNECTDYNIQIKGRISNQRIDGVDLLSAANASGNLDISNSTAGPKTSNICAMCIRFCPIFTVPNGVEMTVNVKP